MINQEKVCDMTKMAAYEDRFGSRELKICMFRRKDFVALEMIKSFFLGTVSYAVILVLYLFCHLEFIDQFNTFASMKKYGIRIGIAYVIFLGAYLVLTFFYARAQHAAAQKNTAGYMRKIRRIHQLYRKEEKDNAGDQQQ